MNLNLDSQRFQNTKLRFSPLPKRANNCGRSVAGPGIPNDLFLMNSNELLPDIVDLSSFNNIKIDSDKKEKDETEFIKDLKIDLSLINYTPPQSQCNSPESYVPVDFSNSTEYNEFFGLNDKGQEFILKYDDDEEESKHIEGEVSGKYKIINQDNDKLIVYNSNTDDIEIISHDDFIFAGNEFANCNWNVKEKSIILGTQIPQNVRRQKRTLLTEIFDIETIYNFIKSMLEIAVEREFQVDNNSFDYYVFSPYNAKRKEYDLDEFSDRSVKSEIGIKTKLDEKCANFLLSCYYIFYNGISTLTSDEIIFEEIYRNCVLMQDDNFDLAKYYENVINYHMNKFDMMTSVLSECLQLKTFGNKDLQFNIWMLTYSNQCKLSNSNDNFITINDLLSFTIDDLKNGNKSLKKSLSTKRTHQELTSSDNKPIFINKCSSYLECVINYINKKI